MSKNRYAPALLISLLSSALWAAPGPTEKSLQSKASQILPQAIVAGTNSQVLDPVENDGYLNIYRLQSKFGELKVVSTATLYERVHEFDAIAQMDKLKGSNEFTKAVKAQAEKVVEGGVDLITDPIGTTKNAISGVGRMFQNIGRAISGGGEAPSSGDSLASEASGFSKVKRAYARQFKVDPYSRNPYLQETLKDVSQAGFLGGAITSLGLGQVGGLAGAMVNVASTSESLGELVTSKSGQDVADYNTQALKKMGVDDDLADLFLRNANFTISERTAIVLALDSMENTRNREDFIKFAVLTDDPDVAAFRRHQIEMYATYSQKRQPIQEFRFLDQFAVATQKDGSTLLMAPLDQLLWTQDIATYVDSVDQRLASQAGPTKYLWFSGTASPLARKNLTQAGWKLQEKAWEQLK